MFVLSEGSSYFDKRKAGGLEWEWFRLTDLGLQLCQAALDDKDFVDFVKNKKFDLVVVDSLANECAYGWTWMQKSKLILFNTANPFPWWVDKQGGQLLISCD